MPAPDLPRVAAPIARLVVRLPNWLGDVVMAAPALAALAAARPETRRMVECAPALVPLARLLPGVDEVVARPAGRGPAALSAQARALGALRADAALILPRSLRAALAPWRARIPVRVGWGTRWTAPFLTHAARHWRPLRAGHRSRWFAALASAFGGDPEGLACGPLAPTAEQRVQGAQVLHALGARGDAPLVVLEPGAAYGPAKCWPAERYGRLAAGLLAQGLDVLTVGTPASAAVEARVARHAGPGLLKGVGRTPDLGALIGVLARARLLVSNDTGPMHLAAALGTPVLALFGATDPAVSRPLGPGPRRLVFDPEPCSPCFLRTCPVPGHPCLEKLGVARVAREVSALLAPD